MLNSDLVTVGPRQLKQIALAGASLIEVPLEDSPPASSLVIIRRHDSNLTPAGSYLLELMRGAGMRGDAVVYRMAVPKVA